LAAVAAYDAVQAAGNVKDASALDKAGGVSIKLSLGTSKSSSTTNRDSSSAFGSTVSAGKDWPALAFF
jgi:filamentous hemagglutinin